MGLANFYCHFIQSFNKIEELLILILKKTKIADMLILILIKTYVNRGVEISGSDLEPILSKTNKTYLTKSKILAQSKIHINVRVIGFLIFKARIVFT